MTNRGIFAIIFATFALLAQSCSNNEESKQETVLKITNSEEFISFINDFNSGKFHLNDSLISPLSVVLESDISITNDNLVPIGSEEYPFIGKFNGNGHTITCCGIGKLETADNVGLFGYVRNSEIKSMTIVTDHVVGANNVGVVCGYAYRTNISDCKVSGNVEGLTHIGGVVGCASYGGISDCYFVGNVSGRDYLIGGIVGMMEFGGIVRSYAGGRATGRSAVNSISGSSAEDVLISECVERVSVTISKADNCKTKRDMTADKLTRLLFQM